MREENDVVGFFLTLYANRCIYLTGTVIHFVSVSVARQIFSFSRPPLADSIQHNIYMAIVFSIFRFGYTERKKGIVCQSNQSAVRCNLKSPNN